MTGVRVFWTYTGSATQTNVAGGNIVIHFAPAANTAIQVLAGAVFTAASRTCDVLHTDEDVVSLTSYAAVALNNQTMHFPSVGTTVAAGNSASSQPMAPVPGDGSALQFRMISAANTESVVISFVAELFGTVTAPSAAVSRSTGTVAAATATQNDVTIVPIWS